MLTFEEWWDSDHDRRVFQPDSHYARKAWDAAIAAARAELLAGVEVPEPAKGQYFICIKCGMHGAGSGALHQRPDGTPCGYLAYSEGPYYTADQLRAAIAAARAEQREADAGEISTANALRAAHNLRSPKRMPDIGDIVEVDGVLGICTEYHKGWCYVRQADEMAPWLDFISDEARHGPSGKQWRIRDDLRDDAIREGAGV